ncbi:MAG: YfhO family protein [Bacteroidia bacterium]|nr:YfhO family protein [Bacteroidia bacterium]
MKSFSFKTIAPHLVAVVLFLIVTYAYFSPLLEGKQIKQSDVTNFYGMSKEAMDYKEATGETALWTNSMFGGMPTYLIIGVAKSNLFIKVHNFLTLGGAKPAGMVFLYLLGFYIALLAFRVNPWLSIAGALAYGFSSYFFIILEPGHITKAIALGYMPALIGGVYLAYNRKILMGGLLFGVFLTLQLLINHLQITYYTFIIILVLGIFEFVRAIREKLILNFAKATVVLLFTAILAIGSNFTNLWLTSEYGKYSMRGKTELTSDKENQTAGLEKDYATAWSYGKAETLTLLIPNINGGSSGGELSKNSETYDYFNKLYGSMQAEQIVKQMPLYWGDQPFTSGPVYAGAVVMFLFVLGLFLLKGHLKWWLLIITIISIMLAWGKNFMGLTDFFLEYVPGYNKFRTVSMILIIAEFALPLLAVLTIDNILKEGVEKKKLIKCLKWSLGIVGGIVLIITVVPSAFFDFSCAGDAQYAEAGYPMKELLADRETLLRMDGFRSLVFIILIAAVVLFAGLKKLKPGIAILIVGVLFIADLWPVNKRYLNNDMFISKADQRAPFLPSQANLDILKDTDPNFRVLNIAANTFNDASTSYFHKSIGGYHGAKMKRYQELIDKQISKNNMQVLNMLNTKYIIVPTKDKGPVAQQNPYAMGNAWFVKSYKLAENADSELSALTNFDPAKEAIVDKRYASMLTTFKSDSDSTSYIKLTKYSPNYLSYESNSKVEQLAVFSEIYYDKGWNVFIDDKPATYFRANYVLRAMIIPASKHKIEFKFEPEGYIIGEKVSLASSILLVLMLLGTAFFEIRNSFKRESEKKVEKI